MRSDSSGERGIRAVPHGGDAGRMALPRLADHVGESVRDLAGRSGQARELALLDRVRCDFDLSIRGARTHVRCAADGGLSRRCGRRIPVMVQDLARSRATDLIPHDILVHVPGFLSGGTQARAARMYGGTVNASYRVDTSAGRFVVRIHDALSQTLGANHE